MTRLATLFTFAFALTACNGRASSEHYGFIARLGRDTVSAERVTRSGNTVVSDEVDRFPRVRLRHTEITLRPDGGIQHLVMDVRSPSEPPPQRERHIVADVTNDSVVISKHDSTGTKHVAYATGGVLTMAHVSQMYSLLELYFAAALKQAAATKLAAGDSVHLHQFYLDREFDNFPLHNGFVRPVGSGKAEIWHDWISGMADATLDSAGRLLTYSGARSTYKVEVQRLAVAPDVEAIGKQFVAMEANNGGAKQLSVRDTARATIGRATFTIDYGRPLARGRVLLGDVITYDEVWRTGANAATQFSTSAPITLAGLHLPAGTYTLWTIPHTNKVELVVNKETRQWGTDYDSSFELGTTPLKTEVVTTPVEKFTISIAGADATHGTLALEWGTFRWTAPIVVSR
jgi:Protein of unknown function (DUF2911)